MLLLETCRQAFFLLTRQLWLHVEPKTLADYRIWEWSSWQGHQLPVVTYETVSEKDPISFISPCVIWEARGQVIFRIIIFKHLPHNELRLQMQTAFSPIHN